MQTDLVGDHVFDERSDDRAETNRVEEEGSVTIAVNTGNPARAGAVDAVSMRGLYLVIKSLGRRHGSADDDMNRAIAKTININGAMARILIRGNK